MDLVDDFPAFDLYNASGRSTRSDGICHRPRSSTTARTVRRRFDGRCSATAWSYPAARSATRCCRQAVRVAGGAVVENSILLDDVVIGEGARGEQRGARQERRRCRRARASASTPRRTRRTTRCPTSGVVVLAKGAEFPSPAPPDSAARELFGRSRCGGPRARPRTSPRPCPGPGLPRRVDRPWRRRRVRHGGGRRPAPQRRPWGSDEQPVPCDRSLHRHR